MRYDLAIVGGGILGAGIARDATLRGFSVVIVDKEDWASGTTSRSTRLIHGGLRYLAQYDFALVKEALTERRRLLRNAPHLVRPLPFILPVYGGKGHPVPMLWSGMLLYDYLQPRRGLPHHRFLPPRSILSLEPAIKSEGLRGGFLFYDAQCRFPERLCLENILDARSNGATTLNHHRVTGLTKRGTRVTGLEVKDDLSGKTSQIEATLTINCTGPWLDDIEHHADGAHVPKLRPTKGVHLVVPAFVQHAVIFESQDADRVVFLIPWGEHTLIGTTDTDYDGDPDKVRATKADIDYLLGEVRNVLGHAPDRGDILYTTAGLRPLLRQLDRTTAQVSRRHVLLDHEALHGRAGYATVLGGKITTYRQIAQDVVDFCETKVDRRTKACVTHRRALPGGRIDKSWDRFVHDVQTVAATLRVGPDTALHLADHYGARATEVLDLVRRHPTLGKRIDPKGPWIWAQVEYAVDTEDAKTLADVLLRRVSLGLTGGQGRAHAPAVVRILAQRFKWDAKRMKSEVAAYEAALRRNWASP